MGANDDLLLKEFLIESYEGLGNIKNIIDELEKDSSKLDKVNDLFRAVHTLKGSASFLGFAQLKNLSHVVESLLDHLRQGTLKFTKSTLEILEESFDVFQIILKKIEESKSESGIDISYNVKKIENYLLEIKAETKENSKVEIRTPTNAVSEQQISTQGPKQVNLSESSNELLASKDQAQLQQSQQSQASSIVDSVVKVNVKLLDQIMNMVGELVVNRNQILQFSSKLDDYELLKLTHQLDTITSELQNEIMATRMQPVGQILGKFERVVRDLARSQGKKVQLMISGQETELDKTLIEAIKDPLTHLIRNAVDHGIEFPNDRLKAKKSETAILKIMAFHENGKVSIKIQDDGRGIDPDKIREKAIEKGIVSKDQSSKMSEKELVLLIFAPGFSTAEKVTDISGRGVGMDVVKTNIEKIGGEIDIQTKKGQGTTFTLKIPLTLAIIPSLTVYSNKKPYCIPQLNIVEFVLLDLNLKNGVLHQTHGVNFFRLREKLVPIYSLESILEESSSKDSASKLPKTDFLNIVVVNGDGQEYGLAVDAISDIEEIVVKPLSKNLKSLEYYSGATIMGNGEIALILETSSIIKKVNPNRVKAESKKQQEQHSIRQMINDGTRDFLIFSLRDQKKYGLSLSFIDRIEEINKDELNFSGTRIFTKYRGQVMPLVDVQSCIDNTQKLKVTGENVQVLVINIQGHLIGLIVENVFDACSIMDDVDEFANHHIALSGTVFIEKTPILIINLTHVVGTINIQIKDKGRTKSVYHVDDSNMHRNIFRDIIETEFNESVEIISFSSVYNFLDFLSKNPDKIKENSLLVTDIDMPEMDGWELSKEVHSKFNHLRLQVFSLTSRDQLEDKERSKEVQITRHLKKFNKIEILEAVRTAFGWSRISSKEQLSTAIVDQSVSHESQYCGFKIGNETYAIPISDVQEVVKAQIISSVPKSLNVVTGLINLRGQIVTSICLGGVFYQDYEHGQEHMNVIVRGQDGLASLIVDEILDVMDLDDKEKAQVPDNVSENLRKYFDCVYKRPKELVTVVNVNTLLSDVL